MILSPEQMAFQARALAQSDPFTALARTVLQSAMEDERKVAPGNASVWASSAFTKGYCVRRVEEDDAGHEFVAASGDTVAAPEEVSAAADAIATALRTDSEELHEHLMADEEQLLEVLDQIIASEVGNRLENMNSVISSRARVELEDYITYWVVKGYALRAAELATGALTKA
jgi:hypothetical protein